MADKTETLSFKTPPVRKRLAKILAAKLDREDVTDLMNYLLQREIDRYFSAEVQEELLSGNEGVEDAGNVPKASGQRRRRL